MVRRDVVQGNLFTDLNVPQSKKENVSVSNSHVAVRLAGVVNVMRAVAATGSVKTPSPVDRANAQLASARGSGSRFLLRDFFSRVLGDLPSFSEQLCGKTPFAVNR